MPASSENVIAHQAESRSFAAAQDDKRVERYTADDPRKVRPPYAVLPSGTIGPIDSYFVVEPGVSFGGTPMTLTPAPREMSIAWMIRSYFTSGEPFTKMIFSGRGS